MAAGASVIDVGAESTRPGATPLSAGEEWDRLAPLLPELLARCKGGGVEVSVDTRHAKTAERALALGADWINDVSGLADPAMRAVVRDASCSIVVMHSLSIPADKARVLPEDAEPVAEVLAWWQLRKAELAGTGIAPERLIFDPGIGFGKTAQQSLALLRGVVRLQAEGTPLLIGHSRKSFLSAFTEAPAGSRDLETAVVSGWLARQGVTYLRVHALAENALALQLSEALDG